MEPHTVAAVSAVVPAVVIAALPDRIDSTASSGTATSSASSAPHSSSSSPAPAPDRLRRPSTAPRPRSMSKLAQSSTAPHLSHHQLHPLHHSVSFADSHQTPADSAITSAPHTPALTPASSASTLGGVGAANADPSSSQSQSPTMRPLSHIASAFSATTAWLTSSGPPRASATLPRRHSAGGLSTTNTNTTTTSLEEGPTNSATSAAVNRVSSLQRVGKWLESGFAITIPPSIPQPPEGEEEEEILPFFFPVMQQAEPIAVDVSSCGASERVDDGDAEDEIHDHVSSVVGSASAAASASASARATPEPEAGGAVRTLRRGSEAALSHSSSRRLRRGSTSRRQSARARGAGAGGGSTPSPVPPADSVDAADFADAIIPAAAADPSSSSNSSSSSSVTATLSRRPQGDNALAQPNAGAANVAQNDGRPTTATVVLAYPVLTAEGHPTDRAILLSSPPPENELFEWNTCMGLFLFGFLFPPLWILGAVLGARAASAAETATATKGADVGVAAAADTGGESGRVRAMRVWGVANGVLAAFSAVVAVALVIWGASTGFAWH